MSTQRKKYSVTTVGIRIPETWNPKISETALFLVWFSYVGKSWSVVNQLIYCDLIWFWHWFLDSIWGWFHNLRQTICALCPTFKKLFTDAKVQHKAQNIGVGRKTVYEIDPWTGFSAPFQNQIIQQSEYCASLLFRSPL